MLDLKPSMSIADLGSGVGLTACTFAKFGCNVSGFEVHAKSCEIVKRQAKLFDVSDKLQINCGATNDFMKDN